MHNLINKLYKYRYHQTWDNEVVRNVFFFFWLFKMNMVISHHHFTLVFWHYLYAYNRGGITIRGEGELNGTHEINIFWKIEYTLYIPALLPIQCLFLKLLIDFMDWNVTQWFSVENTFNFLMSQISTSES